MFRFRILGYPAVHDNTWRPWLQVSGVSKFISVVVVLYNQNALNSTDPCEKDGVRDYVVELNDVVELN